MSDEPTGDDRTLSDPKTVVLVVDVCDERGLGESAINAVAHALWISARVEAPSRGTVRVATPEDLAERLGLSLNALERVGLLGPATQAAAALVRGAESEAPDGG